VSDKRWDAGVGAGGGHPGSNAKEERSLDVDQRSRGQAYPSKARMTAAARGAARSSGVDIRSAATGKIMYGGFQLKCPHPAPLRSEPRSNFPTQPLLSSVPATDARMP
jgi:hypothetical protein